MYEAFYLQLAIIALFSLNSIAFLYIHLLYVSTLDYSLYPKYIHLKFKSDPISIMLKTLVASSHYTFQ